MLKLTSVGSLKQKVEVHREMKPELFVFSFLVHMLICQVTLDL